MAKMINNEKGKRSIVLDNSEIRLFREAMQLAGDIYGMMVDEHFDYFQKDNLSAIICEGIMGQIDENQG